ALACIALASMANAGELSCPTKSIEFKDAFAGSQLLVADGSRDGTRLSKYTSSNPAVARVDSRGYVTPAGNGSTTIRVAHADQGFDIARKVSRFGNGPGRDM